jgi:hypothetical protein
VQVAAPITRATVGFGFAALERSATDTQIVLFNLFNFGGIVVVSVLGIVALLIIARRWDRA